MIARPQAAQQGRRSLDRTNDWLVDGLGTPRKDGSTLESNHHDPMCSRYAHSSSQLVADSPAQQDLCLDGHVVASLAAGPWPHSCIASDEVEVRGR